LDILVLEKDPDGMVVESSLGADEDFGALVSRMFPVSGGSAAPAGSVAEELWTRAQSLPTGTTVVFVLLEQRWARGIATALEEEGGVVLGSGLLTPELGLAIGTEVATMEDAARSIAEAQASETEARLRAIAAWNDAEQAVEESARIRSAAAVDVIRTLTDAGLIEAAATDEAVDALATAGLIVGAADQAADRAVEADAKIAAEADRSTAEALTEDTAAVTAADQAAGRAVETDTEIAAEADRSTAEALTEASATVANGEARTADARAAASVTPAELRVLRYLPTRLTFALIADKLGISREAAKSRAERLYRRLGVHDRATAVERARALKVLP
jgi:DNA-binding CsgD family transcriptional regulator